MGWDADLDEAPAGPSSPRQPWRAKQTTSPPHSQWSPSSWSTSSSSPRLSQAGSTPNMSLSCVTREFSQECSYSRFVAWAAVKRNSHHLIQPNQKLECPLVRCGKVFQDHETMLMHLAKCEHLATREYWCHDHQRIERFDDIKCKRCISHPSRRRRMLSVAKKFFNTLGKKTKEPIGLTSAVEQVMLAPPSYHESESLNVVDLPEKPELSSTAEILEIDSTEVTALDPPVPAIDPQELFMPEFDCLPVPSSMQWQPTPIIPSMSYEFSIAAPAYESLSAARPTSQIPSTNLSQSQTPSRSFPPSARSKNLSPSSSVRSTTSTTSNVSAISASSSTWSAPSTAWSGMETNLTSPSVGPMISPHDYNPNDWFDPLFEGCPSRPLDVISELPADMPDLHELASGDFTTMFAFGADLPSTHTSYPADMTVAEVVVGDDRLEASAAVQALGAPNQPMLQSETKSLAAAAWDALSEHILSSHAKIKRLRNPLANQLSMLSPQTIAHKGLTTLRSLLDGKPLTSPLDTLSLIHIIYSFSLAIHGDDVAQRSKQLFEQSFLYSVWFCTQDQVQFREVVTAIWQPSAMTDVQLDQLSKGQSSSLSSDKDKGKGNVISPDHRTASSVDPLISTAQAFLDEIERRAVVGTCDDVFASEIRARHKQNEMSKNCPHDPSTVNASRLMKVLNILVNQFHEVDGLIARLSEIDQCIANGLLGSTRRLELEALQAGQHCIVTSTYHDSYAPLVHNLCDPIYELDSNLGLLCRQDFYALGISLTESLITDLQAEPMDSDAVSTIGPDNDATLEFLTPPWTDYLMDMDSKLSPPPGHDTEDDDIQPAPTHRPMDKSSSTNADTATVAAIDLSRSASSASSSKSSTRNSPPPASSSVSPTQQLGQESQPQQQKFEEDACCKICGYRPKGDPRWFHGSMAKHRKLQHSTDPPKIYKCSYPGCSSAFKNRPDNLRQHQIEKGHFVDGQERPSKRPSKRKKVSS